MSNLDTLLDRVSSHPEDTSVLLALMDAYLAESTTADQRKAMRAVAAKPEVRTAYEDLYFEGADMEWPERFVRRTLAALFLTAGYGDPDTGRRVSDELRLFAAHHGVDFQSQINRLRALPGARPPHPRRLRFTLGMLALVAALVLGTVAVQALPDTLRLALQIALLLAVVGGQMALLYWYFRAN